MYYNKKGFTLIEIIVSIALASIILLLAGTLILTSTNLLNTSTERDVDKRTVDSVIEFVRSEIEYATDVRIVEPGNKYVPDYAKDDNWHYFYIKNDKLYRDDKDIFSDGFYSNRNFNMTVKANYENSTRVDIKYMINDGRHDTYSSRDTVMLLNLSVSDEMKKDGLYPSQYQPITEDGYRIYYNKKYISRPESVKIGTVADIQDNIFGGNYRGVYTNSGYQYQTGEIAWHRGYWWECTENQITSEPGGTSNFTWKRLDANYSHPEKGDGASNQYASSYEQGDIVIYKGKYYQAAQKLSDRWAVGQIDNPSYWISRGTLENPAEQVKNKEYTVRNVYNNENVVKKYFPSKISIKDPLKTGAENYSAEKTYKTGDIVRIPSDSSHTFYNLYMKVMNGTGGDVEPGVNATSGWLKIDISYSKTSSYLIGDIVIIDESVQLWVQAKQNVDYTMELRPDSNDMYWKF